MKFSYIQKICSYIYVYIFFYVKIICNQIPSQDIVVISLFAPQTNIRSYKTNKTDSGLTLNIRVRYTLFMYLVYNKVKLNQTSRFINSGDKVKITINFRGREIQHTNLAFELLNKFKEDLKDTVDVQQPPTKEGRNLTMVLMPKKK